MTERLERCLNDFKNAVNNLNVAVQNTVNDLEIDGTIKRFELCYELAWKLIKETLANLGIICKNPRHCFKEAQDNDLIDDVKAWLDMIEDRNILVHTYNFKNSRKIFQNIKDSYFNLFKKLLEEVKKYEN